MSLDQKKYKKVPGNFMKAAIVGIVMTVGMGMTAQDAHAQGAFDGVGKHVEKEINKTAKSVLGGIFESMRERMEHDRNERDATYKTGTTANQSAQREAIINGSGANGGNGNGMITTRSVSVDTRSGSNGNSTHTVNSSIRSDNRTQAQLEAQRQRDNYNMERQVQQELLRQELARLRAENERLLQQQQQQQQTTTNNGGSAYYQPTGGSTTTTLSERDQQMLQNCRHLQNNGATVLPDSCNNLLNTTFQITTRR
jgi:hypothetical protein